jgi:hypothetical protein
MTSTDHDQAAARIDWASGDRPGGEWVNALTDALDAQAGLYDRIEQLTIEQAELLDPERATELLRVLAERDRAVAALAQINAQSRPLVRRWNEGQATASAEQRRAIESHLQHIEDCMQRITRRDQEHYAIIQANKERLAGQMAGAAHARTAVTAYGRAGATQARPRYKDQQA